MCTTFNNDSHFGNDDSDCDSEDHSVENINPSRDFAKNVSHFSKKLRHHGKRRIYIFSPKHFLNSEKNSNVLNLIQHRELFSRFPRKKGLHNFGIKHMLQNELFEEYPIELNSDKVFCATWLSDQVILMGTKCNKLLVYNIVSEKLFNIPCLRSSSDSLSCDHHCGIHAVAVNPSKTRLATGAASSNDAAVYSLPDFEPICVGEGAHSDWIFDIKWLDDEFFVSGARDGKIALWHVKDSDRFNSTHNFNYYHMKPTVSKTCVMADKIRALHFKPPNELIAVSLNAYIHSWDMRVFKRLYSQRLPYNRENVCLTYNKNRNVYAVGSFLNVVLLEGHKLSVIKNIDYQDKAFSIRSVSFRKDLLTMGTGLGTMFFYDVAEMDFISDDKKPLILCSKSGNINEYPAVYTHSYDTVGTRLFAAGGPLPMNFHGHYAALWQ